MAKMLQPIPSFKKLVAAGVISFFILLVIFNIFRLIGTLTMQDKYAYLPYEYQERQILNMGSIGEAFFYVNAHYPLDLNAAMIVLNFNEIDPYPRYWLYPRKVQLETTLAAAQAKNYPIYLIGYLCKTNKCSQEEIDALPRPANYQLVQLFTRYNVLCGVYRLQT